MLLGSTNPWASSLMPGSKPPYGSPEADKASWVDDVVSSFAHRHELADTVLTAVTKAGVGA
jgi:hypothetical protein